MNESPPRRRKDEQAQLIALFRYQVIAPLVERELLERGEVTELVRQIASEAHYCPGRGPIEVKERTIYHWRRLYLEGGVDALLPRIRKDKGRPRAIPAKILERAIELRKEAPKRNTSTLIDVMKREGTIKRNSTFHRATLDRQLDRRGASRRRMKTLGTKRTIKMHFECFGDLWVGDYHHGPLVLGPDGKATTAKLSAFIDHTTRYPVAHRYYLAEDLATLRDTLYRALLVWPLPKRVYVDRGSVYRSRQLGFALKRINCHLIHSKAYYSQGRGVIEKWWQVILVFEAEVSARDELLTIHELNVLWEAYCEERYCRRPHDSLGISPAEAITEVSPDPIDAEVVRRLFHIRETRRVHKKDACVSVLGTRFLCESFLRGREVEVEYDPNRLESIEVHFDGERVQRAFPQPVGGTPEPHPAPEQVAQSVDYLALIRRDYDQRLLEHARPLAYASLEIDDTFNEDRFLAVVKDLAGLRPSRSNTREIRHLWKSFGPIPEELVRIGTEHAVRMHGRGRHPRIYLHAIQVLVLSHWRKRNDDHEETK